MTILVCLSCSRYHFISDYKIEDNPSGLLMRAAETMGTGDSQSWLVVAVT